MESSSSESDRDAVRLPQFGDVVAVLRHEWITLEQSERNSNVQFRAGETASIKNGGKLEVLSVDREARRVRVRYYTPPNVTAGGAMCPDRATFWLPLSRFRSHAIVVEWALEPQSASGPIEDFQMPKYFLLYMLRRHILRWLRKIGLGSSISTNSSR
jgi:hypothetical protein